MKAVLLFALEFLLSFLRCSRFFQKLLFSAAAVASSVVVAFQTLLTLKTVRQSVKCEH